MSHSKMSHHPLPEAFLSMFDEFENKRNKMENENNQNHGHKLIKLTHKDRTLFMLNGTIIIGTIIIDFPRILRFPVCSSLAI